MAHTAKYSTIDDRSSLPTLYEACLAVALDYMMRVGFTMLVDDVASLYPDALERRSFEQLATNLGQLRHHAHPGDG